MSTSGTTKESKSFLAARERYLVVTKIEDRKKRKRNRKRAKGETCKERIEREREKEREKHVVENDA